MTVMTITFYYTNKRINSDIQPDVDESVALSTTLTDFYLKDNTSLNNPVFVIAASNMPETNYCIVTGQGFTAERPQKQYYWVNDIVQVRKTVWEVHCTIDALATWKSKIRSQDAFISRSSNVFNPYLNDTVLESDGRYPSRYLCSWIDEHISGATEGYGTYILTLAANGDGTTGGVGGMARYAMTETGARTFLTAFFNPTVLQSIVTQFGDISQFFGGLHWIPVKWNSVSGASVSSISIAGINPAVLQTKRLTDSFYMNGSSGKTFDVQFTHYGDFRDNPPYRNYSAIIPFVGVVDLNSAMMAQRNRINGGTAQINYHTYIDYISGQSIFTLSIDGFELGRYAANTRVDMPISVFTPNTAGMVGGAVAKVQEFTQTIGTSDNIFSQAAEWYKTTMYNLTGLDREASEAAMASARQKTPIVTATEKIGGTVSIIGQFGGSVCQCWNVAFSVLEHYQNTNVEPSSIATLMGRPYHGIANLGSVKGYCQTVGFSTGGNMTAVEKMQINEALNSGVYLT